MKKLALLLLAPTLCFAQTQIGPASGANAGIQIGGNQPGVSSIQGQTGDFTFNGDGFSGCSTAGDTTTCTFTGGGSVTLSSNDQTIGITGSSGTYDFRDLRAVYSLAFFSGLVGAFTDSGGNVIEAVWLGRGPVTLAVPPGATQLQLGVNDGIYTDNTGSWTIAVNGVNYTVLATAAPWLHTAGINPLYPTVTTDATAPTVVPIVPYLVGADHVVIVSYVSGTVQNGAFGPFDSAGDVGVTALASDTANEPGRFALAPPSVSANPMTTLGDLIIGGANGYPERLPVATGYLHWNGSNFVYDTPGGGGGTPGGTTGQLQYNNAGAFGGDTGSTTDGAGNVTTKTVTTTGTVAGQGGTWNATEGTAPSAASGHDLLYADSTAHCIKLSNNGGSFNCIGTGGTVTSVSVTTANGVSGSVATATTTPAITLTLGAITPTSVVPSTPIAHANIASTAVTPGSYTNTNLTVAADGSITAASNGSGGGSGYTNLTGSASETTVALINTACGSGTFYATTPLTIATGGTITCPVQFSKAGVWGGSGSPTVTFAKPVTETDGPTQHFLSTLTVVFAPQTIKPEWLGAVNDWNGTTGTDNAAAINAAITALPSGAIQFQTGACYKQASAISITKSNIALIGGQIGLSETSTLGSKQACIIQSTTSADNVDIAGTGTGLANHIQAVALRNLMLSHSALPTGTATGVSIIHADKTIVDNVAVNDAVNQWYASDTYNTALYDTWGILGWNGLTETSGAFCGFCMDDAAGGSNLSITLVRPHFATNGLSGITSHAFSLTGATISDVFLTLPQSDTATTALYIRNTGGGGFKASDVHVTDPVFDGNFDACIDVNGVAAGITPGIEIKGGWCTTSAGAYAIKSVNSNGMRISGMQIAPNGGATTAAILLQGGGYNQLVGNQVYMGFGVSYKNGGSALVIDGDSFDTVTGNLFLINPTATTTNVILKNTATYNAIETNNLLGGTSANTGISTDATSIHNHWLNSNSFGAYSTQISDLGSDNQQGTSIAWGAITGTLSAQTDLQTALNAKAPLASPTFTGTPDASGATAIKLPVSAGCVSTANGNICYDTTNKNWHLWVNGVDKMLIPLAAGFVSGDCGQPTLSGASWEIQDAGGACGVSGGGSSFSAITTGSNTTATMTVGTGGSIARSGTGSIDASKIGGIAVTGTPSTGMVPTATSSSTATWQVVGGTVESHTASTSAELDFTTCLSSSRDYEIRLSNIVPATNNVDIMIQFSTDGGATYDTTSGHYAYENGSWINGTVVGIGSTSATKIMLSRGNGDVSNTANLGGMSGLYTLFSPGSGGTQNTGISGNGTSTITAATTVGFTQSGYYLQHSAAVNAFRILSTSGNLTSGTATCRALPQ